MYGNYLVQETNVALLILGRSHAPACLFDRHGALVSASLIHALQEAENDSVAAPSYKRYQSPRTFTHASLFGRQNDRVTLCQEVYSSSRCCAR